MNQKENQNPNLTDDSIIEIAHNFDKWLVETGEKYSPLAIQMASIVLGRLMVFTNHVKKFDEFQELLVAVTSMKEAGAIVEEPTDTPKEQE